MNCTRLRQVLDGWLDGELDPATGRDIEQHLETCAACTALKGERNALHARARAELPYFRAPARLKRTVRRSLAAAAGAEAARWRRPTWLQAGALAFVAACIGALAGHWTGLPARVNPLPEQVVASHVASLGASGRLTEVVSADRHVVKPWFQGKVDFAPVVLDLSEHGYVLLGGRIDHVADRQAAAIAYRLRSHVVNLFTWQAPSGDETPVALAAARGFNVASWSEKGLRFAAVSDVDARDLERFAQLVRAPPPR